MLTWALKVLALARQCVLITTKPASSWTAQKAAQALGQFVSAAQFAGCGDTGMINNSAADLLWKGMRVHA
jgi:hypothetical protein